MKKFLFLLILSVSTLVVSAQKINSSWTVGSADVLIGTYHNLQDIPAVTVTKDSIYFADRSFKVLYSKKLKLSNSYKFMIKNDTSTYTIEISEAGDKWLKANNNNFVASSNDIKLDVTLIQKDIPKIIKGDDIFVAQKDNK